MKAPSPLLGFNNNVRHKGRVFHIQTEDSGIRHPHVITHLFADGGRILKTTKTSYAEHIGNERLAETVRAMMQEQHKAMFIALRDGQYDYLFEEGAARTPSKSGVEAVRPPPPAPPSQPEAPPPSSVVAPPPSSSVVGPPPSSVVAPPAPVAMPAAPPPPASPAPPASPPPRRAISSAPAIEPARSPAPPPRPAAVAHYAPTEPARPAVAQPPVTVPRTPPPPKPPAQPEPVASEAASAPPSRRRANQRPTLDVDPGAIHGVGSSGPSIDLDLDALERAAAEAQTPFYQQIQDLPPPPAAVLGSKRTGGTGYSVRSAPPPPAAPQAPGTPPARAPTPAARPGLAASPGRYAPSRPASIFATTRPQEGASIFGEDLISEKSLDEVILSYLAEDLDGPVDKK